MTILNLTTKSNGLFLADTGRGIARYDIVNHPEIEKITKNMREFYWFPDEIDMNSDKVQFPKLSDAEKFIYTKNLQRQILLDTEQGRGPISVFLPFCTDLTLENAIGVWGNTEMVHSESYTHIIRALYHDPSVVYEEIPNIKPIADCAKSISLAYDNLSDCINKVNEYGIQSVKEKIYLALISANALEAIRFYVSFACNFSFKERNLLDSSYKIMKLICRDENVHLVLVNKIINILNKTDPEFKEIILDNRSKAIDIFNEAAEQEKEWASYLFSEGAILLLNENILHKFIDHLMNIRMPSVGLAKFNRNITNPISWFDKHLSNDSIQVAPQEVEIASYLTGNIKGDLSSVNLNEMWDDF